MPPVAIKSTYPKCREIQAALADLNARKFKAFKALKKLQRNPKSTPAEVAEAQAVLESAEADYRRARMDAVGL